MIRIACGSTNPVKVDAAKLAFDKICGTDVDVVGFKSSSGVPDQPVGVKETETGAINRAMRAYAEFTEAEGEPPAFAVGMEGGIDGMNEGDPMVCFAAMCVYNGKQRGIAHTATFILPEKIGELVRGGMELGDADDAVFKTVNSKQGQGTIGALTHGIISRRDYYVPAIIMAHIPFNFPTLY